LESRHSSLASAMDLEFVTFRILVSSGMLAAYRHSKSGPLIPYPHFTLMILTELHFTVSAEELMLLR
jgi:hypothetical protein